MCYRIKPVIPQWLSEYLVDPHKLSLEVCQTQECEKKQAKFLFTVKFAFFFKSLCFQQLLRCNRINPLTSKASVKIGCGFSRIPPSGLSHSRIGEKTGHKLFFTGKFAFFFKNLCFQQLLRCYRIIPVTSTVIIKILCWPV